MKKRIFSLLLVAIMLLSLALVSCDDTPEEPSSSEEIPTVTTPTGEVVPAESVLGKFEYDAEDPAKIELGEKVSFTSREFTLVNSYGNFLVYRKDIKDEAGAHIIQREWHIFNPGTGKSVKITTPELTGEETPEQLKDMITNISFSREFLFDESFIRVTLTYGEGGDAEYAFSFYDKDVKEVLKIDRQDDYGYPQYSTLTASRSDGASFFRLCDNLYRVDFDDEGYISAFVLVNDINKLTVAYDTSYIRYLTYSKDTEEYFYTESQDKIYVLDKTLVLKDVIEYERVVGSGITVVTLANGSKLITETFAVPDCAVDFTYFSNGTKYIMTRHIYSSEKGLVEVDNIGYVGNIYSVKALGLKAIDTTIENIMINVSKIDENKGLVSTVDYVVIDNDGKAVKVLENPLSVSLLEATKLANGAIVEANIFEMYVVDENGKKIATVPVMVETNNKWFVTEKEVFDPTMKSIYTIPETREIVRVMDNAILFGEEYKDDGGNTLQKLILWTGVDAETVICENSKDNTVSYTDSYYTIKTPNTGSSTYNLKIYDSTGAELYSAVNVSSFNVGYNYIQYTVYNTENGETTTVYVPVIRK